MNNDIPPDAGFAVVVDTREPVETAYGFEGIRADSRRGYRPLVVPTVRRKLDAGDYSIDGFEDAVSIDRKETSDFLSCVTHVRGRWERCLERLGRLDYGAVVIESELGAIVEGLASGRFHSNVAPSSVVGSVIAWSQRFGVAFWFLPGRSAAERMTFRLLERFHLDVAEGKRSRADFSQPMEVST